WVPLVNPNLSYVQHISEIQDNHFTIIAGGGYPHYYEVIDAAIDDVNGHGNIDRLVVAVDSEEMAFDEKYAEIDAHLSGLHCIAEVQIVIQHFCLETWALGNRIMVRQNPQDPKLREYRRFYNVRNRDPELLPAYPPEELNRAQFAEKYLRRALQDKYRNLTYTKSNPKALLHFKYFQRVRERLEQAGHIYSFKTFLTAFV
ncbi:MAG: hypothetical protein O7E52_09130, partial [Candidatus Poribacteria bacterium]|nr:hypothetical protein [Candidatus Poribacteria bacterium]